MEKTILRLLLISSFSCLFGLTLLAQASIEGLWVGKITVGGIYSDTGYRFELYLDREGKHVTGRSYIYLNDTTKFEMDMRGIYFQDRSIYFEEVNYMPIEGQEEIPEFLRVYELMHKRSIWESTLNGYWQEKKLEKMGPNRKRG